MSNKILSLKGTNSYLKLDVANQVLQTSHKDFNKNYLHTYSCRGTCYIATRMRLQNSGTRRLTTDILFIIGINRISVVVLLLLLCL